MKTNHNIASMLRFVVLCALVFTISAQNSQAAHLVGGEMTYECQGNNDYLIRLQIFRDCNCTQCADFDKPAYIFIYDNAGTLVSTLSVPFTGSSLLNSDINNPCLAFPPDVCVEQTVYTVGVNLPPSTGGYDIVHQRCCRNNTILNIFDPGAFGSTYLAHIPDPGFVFCNNSPVFNNLPPISLCMGDTLSFNHSATDIDGDSLVYELCTPYSGASQTNPQPNPMNPPTSPPYGFVNFVAPYSASNPLDGALPLSIDLHTGLLTGSPPSAGQFVVGVCVSEYRNGILISTNKRDVQFNVVVCDAVVTASIPSFVLECDDYTVNFANNGTGGTYYSWDFGDGVITTSATPAHTYPDTGVYYTTMIVNPGWSCADTAYSEVNVYPGMTANYSYVTHCADSNIPFSDLSVSFNGLITDWIWNFGDGGTSTAANPSYNYAVGGSYTVQLVTINDKGCTDVQIQEIYVYLEPEPFILFNTPCEKTAINFEDGTQLDSGYVVSWDWDIAGVATDTDPSTSYVFNTSGIYDITLAVVTEHGCDGIITQSVFIKPIPESEAGSDAEVCPGDVITIGGPITAGYSYAWDPPNGLSSTLDASPTLVLSNDSNLLITHSYIVTTSLNGCTSSDTVSIGVFPEINPKLPAQLDQCLPDNQFDFDAEGVYGPNAVFDWDYGDGTSGTGGNSFSYTYAETGIYTVSVTIEDNGCTEVATTELRVYEVPTASFNVPDDEGCTPFETSFEAFSSDPTIDDSQYIFIWDFKDGSPLDSNQITTHIYTEDGIYYPSLTIILGACSGYEAMTQQPFEVEALPTPIAGMYLNPTVASLYDPFVNVYDISEGADNCWLVIAPGDTIDICNYEINYYDPTSPYNEITTKEITQIVRNGKGCRDMLTLSIDILPEYIFFAPSSFSPNNDGLNDLFLGRGFGIVTFEMMIYNRWGDMIWRTQDLYEGWDGIANQGMQPAQQEMYVYVVKIVDIYDTTHELVGKVALVR